MEKGDKGSTFTRMGVSRWMFLLVRAYSGCPRQTAVKWLLLLLLLLSIHLWICACVPPHTHTRLMALFPGSPRWATTRSVKPIWILLKQETMNGSGISYAICNSAPCSRQITTPAPHHSVILQAGCPSCHPTNSVKGLKALHACPSAGIFWPVCHWLLVCNAVISSCEMWALWVSSIVYKLIILSSTLYGLFDVCDFAAYVDSMLKLLLSYQNDAKALGKQGNKDKLQTVLTKKTLVEKEVKTSLRVII